MENKETKFTLEDLAESLKNIETFIEDECYELDVLDDAVRNVFNQFNSSIEYGEESDDKIYVLKSLFIEKFMSLSIIHKSMILMLMYTKNKKLYDSFIEQEMKFLSNLIPDSSTNISKEDK